MSPRFFLLFATLTLTTACVSSDPVNHGTGGEGAWAGYGGYGAGAEGAGEPVGGSVGDGGGSSGTVCGDFVCGIDETCASCPEDCTCGSACGDGTCQDDEGCDTCEADCGACPTCGDGSCDLAEDCASCFEDCGICPCMPDSFEPNQSSPNATTVQHGVDYCQLSICSGDVDWLELTTTGSFTAKITFFQAQGDLELEIYSGITGNYVTGSYSADDNEQVTVTGVAAGTYWARVYGDAAENPDYCFRVD